DGDDVCAEHPDDPARGSLREVEHLQKRRLARAAGAGQEIEAARIKGECDVAQDFPLGPVAQADVVELDDAPLPPPHGRSRERRWRNAGICGAYSGSSMWKKGIRPAALDPPGLLPCAPGRRNRRK